MVDRPKWTPTGEIKKRLRNSSENLAFVREMTYIGAKTTMLGIGAVVYEGGAIIAASLDKRAEKRTDAGENSVENIVIRFPKR